MISTHVQQWMEHPDTLDRNSLYELRTMVAHYPYFQSLRLLYLKNLYLLHDINFGAELRKSVLYVSDRRMLFYLIEGERYSLKTKEVPSIFDNDLEQEPSIDRTLFLIDAFLAAMPEERIQNTKLDYVMDYTAYLMQEDEQAESSSLEEETNMSKLIEYGIMDSLIHNDEDNIPGIGKGVSEDEESVEGEILSVFSVKEEFDDSCFTETLAKIYIKQHRYDRALEIIKKLSLNYPKKNAYFADQIGCLEKLITNAKSK